MECGGPPRDVCGPKDCVRFQEPCGSVRLVFHRLTPSLKGDCIQENDLKSGAVRGQKTRYLAGNGLGSDLLAEGLRCEPRGAASRHAALVAAPGGTMRRIATSVVARA